MTASLPPSHRMPPTSLARVAGGMALLLISATHVARAQQDASLDTARQALKGDGLVHGAPLRPVSDVMLVPGQVQQLNLHPRFSVTLLFPYPIDHLSGGDKDVLNADSFRSDLTLVPTAVTQRETNFQVHFVDPTHPPIAFRVRVDTTQPAADLIRYVDPVDRYLRRVRSDFEAALRADEDRRVETLATDRVQHLILLASEPQRIDRTARAVRPNGTLEARVETVQSVPDERGRPHLWVRYRVTNRTSAPLTDLVTIASVVQRSHRFLFFQRRRTRELGSTRDLRTAPTVPPGGAVQGVLILDQLQLRKHESLALEFASAHDQLHARIDRVLGGR